jgi:hypothetical protein
MLNSEPSTAPFVFRLTATPSRKKHPRIVCFLISTHQQGLEDARQGSCLYMSLFKVVASTLTETPITMGLV